MRTVRPLAMTLVTLAAVTALAAVVTGCGSGGSSATGKGGTVLLSSQASELTEAQGLRKQVLSGYPPGVTFVPVEADQDVIDRLTAEAKSGKATVDLIGALHGGLVSLQATRSLRPLTGLASQLQSVGIVKSLMDLGKLGTSTQFYIPWMQASYVMIANKKALPYLPAGADVNHLTYAQLLEWATNLKAKTGQPKLGFPASSNGVMKRFLEGYLLPAFTGGEVTTFRSPAAVSAWRYMQSLWKDVDPQSVRYDFMSDPLLSGQVWLAWDHVARLQQALTQKPDDFVVFPAPAGPKGRAFMPVVAGLAIPKTAPNPARAEALIKYLLSQRAQEKTLSATGFFPVVGSPLSSTVSTGLRLEAQAQTLQQTAPDALDALLPVGLGTQSDAFDKVYTDTFTSIVEHGTDPAKVVDSEAPTLQAILTKTGAPCWAPDPAGSGPCQVK